MSLGVTGYGLLLYQMNVFLIVFVHWEWDFEIAICDVRAFLEKRGEIRTR